MKLRRPLAVYAVFSGSVFQARAYPQVISRGPLSPALNQDFPDPSIFQDGGGRWYSYATAGGGKQVQVASAPAPGGPWTAEAANVLPNPGGWTSGRNTWAPDVQKLANDHYVMFYSGELASDTAHHCIGTATSRSALGPFTPNAAPLDCHVDQGGSIDPSGFYDEATETRWLVYKM